MRRVMFSCLEEKKSTEYQQDMEERIERSERMTPWEREKYAAIVVPATPSLFGLVTPRRFWLQLGLNNIQLHYTV